MLHQYNEQPYSDISNRYSSSLNSWSYLLPQTSSKSSEVYENDTKFISEEDFLMRADTYQDAGYCNELRIAADIEKHFPALGTIPEVELPSNTMNEEKHVEDYTTANQLVTAEQNNNVQKTTTEDLYIKNGEVFLKPIVLPIPAESRPNISFNERHEFSQLMNASYLCDENETNFRLPGFHQAFGSTEIGRFVHQKDFIEQINHQQVSFMSTPQNKPFSVPSSSPNSNNANFPKSSKGRAKDGKRLKTPTHAQSSKCVTSALGIAPRTPASTFEMNRNTNWSYNEYDGNPMASPTSNFQSPATYCGLKEQVRNRKWEHQYLESNSAAAATATYCNGEDLYNCSSSYYYDGCSENANCDYYTRYHQNSTQYNLHGCSSVSAGFSGSHAGFTNGCHCDKDHNRYHMTGNDMTSSLNQQNYQNDRYFSSYNDPQVPYHYDKQSYQYQPYTSHNQYSSQQMYSNYNCYTPVPSYNYY